MKVLVISDLQAPFMHRDAVDFLRWLHQSQRRWDEVVCIGDEVDFHAISSYVHDPDGYSPGHELKAAIEALRPIYRLFPRVRVCISNHTSRPFRLAMEAGMPHAFLKGYRELLRAPGGWEWRPYWVIDGVRYEHGDAFGGGSGQSVLTRAAVLNGRSTVFGHFHANAGIHYTSSPESLLFSFNVGCLIDRQSYAFAHAVGSKRRPILGTGTVIDGVPTFHAMLLDKRGRWVSR